MDVILFIIVGAAVLVLLMPWLGELVNRYWEWCERIKRR